MLTLVDTGPLYAAADADDADHQVCRTLFEDMHSQWVIPTLVITECCYLIGSRLGADAEARFLASLASLTVESPIERDWRRMAKLVEKYADFPLGGVDASIVALAERLGVKRIFTLDRRHFAAVRPLHCRSLHIVP